MKKNLLKLHSSRAKFGINFSIIGVIIMLFTAYRFGQRAIETMDFSGIILIVLVPLLTISFIWYYFNAFLAYLDTENNQVIFKKPFRNKEWIVKLEKISVVDTIRFVIVSRAKHIKVTFKNESGKMSDYYILKSSSVFGIGGDDDKTLFDAVLKRKKELLSSKAD